MSTAIDNLIADRLSAGFFISIKEKIMYIKVKGKLINLDMATVINVEAIAHRHNPKSDKYDTVANCVRISFGGISIEFIDEEAEIARAEIRRNFEGYLI